MLAKRLDKLFQMIIMLVIFIHMNAKDGRFSGHTSNWDLTGRGIYSIRLTYQHQPLTATSERPLQHQTQRETVSEEGSKKVLKSYMCIHDCEYMYIYIYINMHTHLHHTINIYMHIVSFKDIANIQI